MLPVPVSVLTCAIEKENGMKTISKIMVAVDFSDYSAPAVRYGAQLAKEVGAGLLLVNVFNQRDVLMMEKVAAVAPGFSVAQHLEENLNERRNNLDQMLDATGARSLKGPVETMVRVGVPYEELLKVITEKRPDLLVMAAKGRSNLADAIVGSCAHKMFRRCPIPLLLLRDKN
jgi:nucleotide-binding universal stress UspA family protein